VVPAELPSLRTYDLATEVLLTNENLISPVSTVTDHLDERI